MSTTATAPRTDIAETAEALASQLAGEWELDGAHSTVGFAARYLVFSKVRGAFTGVTGHASVNGDPARSTVAVTIDAATIDTGNEQRDGHLRGGDFFDVETFPTIEFRAAGFRPGAHPRHRVVGDLTIRGVTRPLELDVEFLGVARDPFGREKAAITASASIDREEWGLTWNQALETGGVLVGKTIDIEIEAQLVRAS